MRGAGLFSWAAGIGVGGGRRDPSSLLQIWATSTRYDLGEMDEVPLGARRIPHPEGAESRTKV